MANYRELSKADWRNEASQLGKWPGEQAIIIGCLQRIAASLESIQNNLACGGQHFRRLHGELKEIANLRRRPKKRRKNKL